MLLVSESTLQRAAVPEPEFLEPPPRPRAQLPGALYRFRWPIGTACLVLLSFGLVKLAGTRPGYDPYGWMIWGYQTLHLGLDLGGAPSWKPMTWLFDVPFALFGRTALWLWMTTAVAAALAGGIFAGRLAHRLARLMGFGRGAALAGAVFAGVSLLGIQDYFHYILSVQSDPMIVTFCLAAVDCYLCGRLRWALALLVLAALGRPEAWPFLGLYAVYVWRRMPSMRWMIAGGVALVPLLWFGIPWVTNGRPLVAGQLAMDSPRALHENKVVGTLHRFVALHYLTVELLALLAVVVAALRRNRLVLLLAGGTIAWLVIEVAFVLHGWPGVPRYLFETAGMTAVLAGFAIAWIIHDLPRLRGGLRWVPAWSGAVVAGVVALTLVPGAIHRWHLERKDLVHEHARTASIIRLERTVNDIGGYKHVRYCGRPVITVEYVSILSWYLKLNSGRVGHRPAFEKRQVHPSVFFQALRHGWSILPWHLLPYQQAAGCASLKSSYVFTGRHPDGTRIGYVGGTFH